MAAGRTGSLIEHIRNTVLRQDRDVVSDGQLLERFVSRRDEAAFEALVQRHAGMVWGVCRRLLHNPHDAEDAFQATFLVLARKAASVKPRDKVANWLYGVAYQTAVRTRALVAKRASRETQVHAMPEPTTVDPALWDQLRPVLDQELARLPDRYREVVIQCDLEGRTRRTVARQLRIPEGTVASRLATGRKLLAKRLARHGLTVTGSGLAAVIAERAAAAGVPATVDATMAGAVSARVAMLTEGVVKVMLIAKLKTMTLAVLLVGAVTLGSGMLVYGPAGAQQETPVQGAGDRTESVPAKQGKAGPSERVLAAPATDNETRLRGEWVVEAKDENWTSLIFGPNGTIRSIRRTGRDEHGTYAVDWRKRPLHLDVTWDGQKTYKSLMEFTGDGKLRIDVGSQGERPEGFSANAYILTKWQPPLAGKRAAYAAKDLAIAEHYERTRHYASARFYYELVRQRYPNTEAATTAAHGLAALDKFRVRRADGSEGWLEPEGQPTAPLPPPIALPLPGDGKPLPPNTPATIVLDNAKITISRPNEMRVTPAKNARGEYIRLEIPGLTVEVPRLTIEAGEFIYDCHMVQGKATMTSTRRKPAPVPSGQWIGRVIIIGNQKTPDAAIRKAADLLPGQPLNAETLLLAERRLAAFNAQISVGSGDPNPHIKDVVITVQEK